MAATLQGEWWDTRDGTDNIKRERTYTRHYFVLTDNVGDDATVAGSAPGLPRNGDQHPNDPGAYVASVSVSQMNDNPYHWLFTAEYDSKIDLPELQSFDPNTGQSGDAASPAQRSADPTLLRPSLTISQQQVHQIARFGFKLKVYDSLGTVYSDTDGDPSTLPEAKTREVDNTIEITNSAGDPFDPPVEVEVMRDVITIEDHVRNINLAAEAALANVTNSDTYLGYEPRTLKLISNERTFQYQNGFWYWTRKRSFAHNPATWDIIIPDVGYREFIPGSQGDEENKAHWRAITEETLGREPQPPGERLNGRGRRVTDPTDKGTYWLRYVYFPLTEFAVLYTWD
jgi:hypothetical protein